MFTHSCHSEISVSGRFHGRVSPWSGTWTFFDRSHGKGGSCLGDCARDDLQPLPTLFSFVSCKFKGQRAVPIKAHFPRERWGTVCSREMPSVRKRRSRKNSRINSTRYGSKLKKKTSKNIKNKIKLWVLEGGKTWKVIQETLSSPVSASVNDGILKRPWSRIWWNLASVLTPTNPYLSEKMMKAV